MLAGVGKEGLCKGIGNITYLFYMYSYYNKSRTLQPLLNKAVQLVPDELIIELNQTPDDVGLL